MRITFEKVRFKIYLVTRQRILQTKCDDLTCCGKLSYQEVYGKSKTSNRKI